MVILAIVAGLYKRCQRARLVLIWCSDDAQKTAAASTKPLGDGCTAEARPAPAPGRTFRHHDRPFTQATSFSILAAASPCSNPSRADKHRRAA